MRLVWFQVRSVRVLGVALTVCAGLLVGCSDAERSPQVSFPTSSATTQDSTPPSSVETAGATVSVWVRQLEGAIGSDLAGVLYRGPEALRPGANAIGGFAVTVDRDPFTTAQQVHQPGEDYVGAFPYVSDEVLLVDPGTYTLVLWLGPELGPYNRWIPSYPVTAVCELTFDVGDDVALDVDGRSIELLEEESGWPPQSCGLH